MESLNGNVLPEKQDEKRGPGRPPKPKNLPVKFSRGYVSAEGVRYRAGDCAELPADEARHVITLPGPVAVRNDPF